MMVLVVPTSTMANQHQMDLPDLKLVPPKALPINAALDGHSLEKGNSTGTKACQGMET